jgi:predicted ATPase/DNA-binding SARP family transcriptional activator
MTTGTLTGNISGGAPWRLELFGGLRLFHNDLGIDKFSTRKTAGILAYLACHRGKAVSRDTLADIFWAETDPESARNSLRVALNALRKILGTKDTADILKSDRLTVRLEPTAFTTDVAEFDAALREEARAGSVQEKIEAVHRAIGLYRGPFLEGWYEEWVDSEQNRLSEIYRNALRRITAYLLDVRDYERALEYAQQAVQADPLREESHRLIIRLHMVMGNPAAAMQQYRDLERILRKELGAMPSGATRELLRQVPPSAPASETIPAAPVPPSPGQQPQKSPPVTLGVIPTPLTPFFGREEELNYLASLLTPRSEGFAPRLLTLTGMGGTGKSRLSVEVARKVQPLFSGGVWFVSLVGLKTPAQASGAIATCLRLPPYTDIAPIDQIVQALNGKRTLFVLDNFEQLIESSASWLTSILERLPLLTCLVTSRYRLDVTPEQEIPVSPLPLPSMVEGDSPPPERLSTIASVALFVDRARAARPDFRLTQQNAGAVAAICSSLDGLPLAIELAAAWARLLTPAEIRNRLRERFDLLVSSHKDVPERHRSLRAVLDGSYHLISEDDKSFFARLSVFRGGWNLLAAEEVTAESNALERLNLLQQRSLLITSPLEGTFRFRMLETVLEYASAQLAKSEQTLYQERHAAYFLKVAENAAGFLNTPTAETWLAALDMEEENLRAALTFSFAEEGQRLRGMRLAAALWRFWYARGHSDEGIHWLETAIQGETEETSDALRISLREGMGRLATSQGRNTLATRFLRQALDLAQTSCPDRVGALAVNLGLAAQAGSDAETAQYAFGLAAIGKEEMGDMWGEATSLAEVAKAAKTLGDDEGMRTALQRSRLLRERVGDTWGEAEIEGVPSSEGVSLFNASGVGPVYLTLGSIASEQDDHAIALPLLKDALMAFREQQDQSGIATTLERIAVSAIACGDRELAIHSLEEALALRREGFGKDAVTFASNLLTLLET